MDALDQKLSLVRLVITDIDGVHTDDTVIVSVLAGEVSVTEGVKTLRLIEADEKSDPDSVHYFSAQADGKFMEGYRFFTGDGIAVKECLRNHIPVIMLSGRDSAAAKKRAEDLGAKYLSGVIDKAAAAERIAKENDVSLSEVLFIGNDIQDLPLARRVGVSAAPEDAVQEVKAEVDYVALRKGGRGAVREILEKMLKSKGLWSIVAQ